MKIDVKHVAKLANLPISDEEEKRLEQELSETLDYIEQLNQIDTSGVEPTSQVTGLENVLREDESSASFSQEEAVANSKNTKDGFFVVKAILDE